MTRMGRKLLSSNSGPGLEQLVISLLTYINEIPDGGIGSETINMEAYSLALKYFQKAEKYTELHEVYVKALKVCTNMAFSDPRLQAGIYEVGGRIAIDEEDWSTAYEKLFDAFKLYQEAGAVHAKEVLKLVIFTNLIAARDINPFDSLEAKAYQLDEDIVAFSKLRTAFQSRDIDQFLRIVSVNKDINEDQIMVRHLTRMLDNMREEKLKSFILSSKNRKMEMKQLADESKCTDVATVEKILLRLLLKKEIQGKIDSAGGMFNGNLPTERERIISADLERRRAIFELSKRLEASMTQYSFVLQEESKESTESIEPSS